jgi:hypothetical protein
MCRARCARTPARTAHRSGTPDGTNATRTTAVTNPAGAAQERTAGQLVRPAQAAQWVAATLARTSATGRPSAALRASSKRGGAGGELAGYDDVHQHPRRQPSASEAPPRSRRCGRPTTGRAPASLEHRPRRGRRDGPDPTAEVRGGGTGGVEGRRSIDVAGAPSSAESPSSKPGRRRHRCSRPRCPGRLFGPPPR